MATILKEPPIRPDSSSVPPPPPVPKKTHRGLIAAGVVGSLLIVGAVAGITGASTGKDAPAAASAPAVPSAVVPPAALPSVAAPACIPASFTQARRNVVGHISNQMRDLRVFNIAGAATQLRLAASDERTMADIARPVSPEITAHLMRSARDLELAAGAFEKFQVAAAVSSIKQGTAEIAQVVRIQTPDMYC